MKNLKFILNMLAIGLACGNNIVVCAGNKSTGLIPDGLGKSGTDAPTKPGRQWHYGQLNRGYPIPPFVPPWESDPTPSSSSTATQSLTVQPTSGSLNDLEGWFRSTLNSENETISTALQQYIQNAIGDTIALDAKAKQARSIVEVLNPLIQQKQSEVSKAWFTIKATNCRDHEKKARVLTLLRENTGMLNEALEPVLWEYIQKIR